MNPDPSNAAHLAMNSATVDVGGVTDQWDVTTEDPDPCVGSPPAPGTVCEDGSIFAGMISSQKMFTTPNSASGRNWNSAVSYCSGLTAHGQSDWELPSFTSETNLLYSNRVAIGGFGTSLHWLENEQNASAAYALNFSNGSITIYNKNDNYNVRCIRR